LNLKEYKGATMKRSIFASIFVLFLFACGSSSPTARGSQSSNPPPDAVVISNLTPTNWQIKANSGTEIANISFTASDFRGNLQAFLEIRDSGLVLIQTIQMNVQEPEGITCGFVVFNLPINTASYASGESGFYDVYVTDSVGTSNVLQASWNAI